MLNYLFKLFNFILKDMEYTIHQMFFHTPKERLTSDEIEQVKEYGLVHFTRFENLDSIKEKGIVAGKHLCRSEKGCTWFCIAVPEKLSESLDSVHSKGERSSYDAYVIVRGLTDEQISELRINRYNDYVMYPHNMFTEDMECGHVDDLLKKIA